MSLTIDPFFLVSVETMKNVPIPRCVLLVALGLHLMFVQCCWHRKFQIAYQTLVQLQQLYENCGTYGLFYIFRKAEDIIFLVLQFWV